jgi:hypothetical protein
MLIFFRRESFSPDTYVGDGQIIYKKPGFFERGLGLCYIDFEPFSLSSEFRCTYKFTGLLSLNEYINEYKVYLNVPPAINEVMIEDATIKMTLHSDGKLSASSEKQIKALGRLRWKVVGVDGELCDGWSKNYTDSDFTIPAIPEIHYELTVHYIPPENVPENQQGYLYLRIGGES